MPDPDWVDTTTSPGSTFRVWYLEYDGPTRGDDAAILTELQAVMPAAGYGDMLGLFVGHPADIGALEQDGWVISYDENATPPWSFSANEIGDTTVTLVTGQPYCYFLNTTGNPAFEPGLIDGLSFTSAPPETPSGEDMSTPDGTVDTTTGGGGDFDGGANDPAYRAPGSGVDDADGNAPDTTATPGGSVADPAPSPATQRDTSDPSGGTGAYRTGDVDNSTPPTQVGDTTQLGGGIGATGTNPYRAPSDPEPATNFDTSSQAGVLSVNPGSPDAAVVGDNSGVNPNGAEPGLTGAANVVTPLDTGGYGSPAISQVPGGTGVPSAPTNVVAVALPNRRAVDITWDAPANALATGVLGYTIQSNTLGTQNVGKDDTYVEFEEGLVGGQTYTFTVYAFGPNGSGYRSAPSAPVTIPTGDLVADTTVAEGVQGPNDNQPH